MKYTAFLSYSHKADKQIAQKVRRALHRISIPWYKKRILNIFLDKAVLSANPGLWTEIQNCLDESEYFILLASKEAAASKWVRKELSYWLGKDPNQKNRRLFLVLTDGQIVWDESRNDFDLEHTTALPPLPEGIFDGEPHYVDLRWAREKKQSHENKRDFQNAIATLAAPMHGVSKETIFSEEARQQKKVIRFISFSAVLFFVLTVVAAYSAYTSNRREKENQSLALASSARMVLGEGNTDLAVALALEGLKTSYPVEEAFKALAEASYFAPGTRRCFFGHKGPVTSVDVHPQDRLFVSGSEDGTVRLWSPDKEKELARFSGHTDQITCVKFSPDGGQILSASLDGSMRLWDIADRKEIRIFRGHLAGVTSAVFCQEGRQIVSGSLDKSVRIWDVDTGREMRCLNRHQAAVTSVAISPDGMKIATGDSDNTLCLWNIGSDKVQCVEKIGDWGIPDLAFDPASRTVLVGGGGFPNGYNIVQVDVLSGRRIGVFRGNSGGTHLSFLPEGSGFLSGTYDNAVRFWDADLKIELHRYLGHQDDVTDIAFCHDGRSFLTGSKDATCRLWYLASPAEKCCYGDKWWGPIALSPDGKTILSGHKKLYLWSLDTGKEIKSFNEDAHYVQCLAFSPDGAKAVSGSIDGLVRVWDIKTRRLERVFKRVHPNRVQCIATAKSPSGRTIVLSGSYPAKSSNNSGTEELLLLWDLDTGRILKHLFGHKGTVTAVDFSDDGGLAVSGSYDKRIIVWDLLNAKPLNYFDGHWDKVTGVAFGPNGRNVLSTSEDMSVRLWDVETEKEVRKFPGHTYSVKCLDLSPNGKQVITGSADRTIRLWDVDTGKELNRYIGHTKEVQSVLFGPAEKSIIISRGDDKTIRIWNLEPPVDLKGWTYKNRFIPSFTEAQKRRYRIASKSQN
jgi:WD40 repeat protein